MNSLEFVIFTKTTALAHVPVTPVISPTINDAIGDAGGCGNRGYTCDASSVLQVAVVK